VVSSYIGRGKRRGDRFSVEKRTKESDDVGEGRPGSAE